eukprot:TRINITY_DN1097_c0_g1_i1.p1 TRINITY_DN1097_c0_g1~~TRINITY_DN1097_c0_g1_i1.p1  ORF type:complete len:389 (+),score=54.98 TRINITY_DN1097_c0_g1_i1:605-1771(+)
MMLWIILLNCIIELIKHLKDGINYEEGLELANRHCALFLETSAKNRINIDEIFTSVIKYMLSSELSTDPKSIPAIPKIPINQLNLLPSSMTQDMLDLLHQGTFSDVKFITDDSIEYDAHRIVLFCRSSSLMEKIAPDEKCVSSECFDDVFGSIIRWIYTDIYECEQSMETVKRVAIKWELYQILPLCDPSIEKGISIGINFDIILNAEAFSDITIQTPQQTFLGHKCILWARSNFMKQILLEDTDHIDCPVPAEHMLFMLRYWYTNTFDISDPIVIDILKTAIYFQDDRIIRECENILLNGINIYNACGQYHIAYNTDTTNQYQVEVSKYTMCHIKLVMKSRGWKLLSKDDQSRIITNNRGRKWIVHPVEKLKKQRKPRFGKIAKYFE